MVDVSDFRFARSIRRAAHRYGLRSWDREVRELSASSRRHVGSSKRADHPAIRLREREQPSGAPQSIRGIIGSIYLPDNAEAIALLASRHNDRTGKAVGVIWGKTAGTSWGASPDLPTAVTRVHNAVRGEAKGSTVSSTLLDVHGTDNEVMRRFRHMFERSRSMRSRRIPKSLEFIRAGSVLAFTVRVGIAASSDLAIGYATTDRSMIDRFEKEVDLEGRLAKGYVLWDPKAAQGEAES